MSRHSRSDVTVRDRGQPDMECAMASHKFHVGEIVNLRPVVSRNAPGEAYEVTKQLPHNGREFEYRPECQQGHERVAGECDLTGRNDPLHGPAGRPSLD